MGDQIVHKSEAANESSTDPALDDEFVEIEEETAEATSNLLQFQRYIVSDTIVDQKRSTIHDIPQENLIEFVNIRSRGFEWILQMRWINETDSDNVHSVSTEEGLTFREGQETEHNFGVSASFRGLGVEIGGARRNFSERETSRAVTVSQTVTAAGKRVTSFYQKQYTFVADIWWFQKVPVWQDHNQFGVGRNYNHQLITRRAVVEIKSNEFATLHRTLTGTTTITASSSSDIFFPPVNRQFRTITQRARTHLYSKGVSGSG